MKRSYFMIRPTEFVTFGDIDREGNTTYQDSKPFNVEDTGENFVIFEVYYSEGYDGRRYANQAREMMTGRMFDMQVIKGHSEDEEDSVLIGSKKCGLFQKRVAKISDVEVKPIRVTGLFNYFKQNPAVSNRYYSEIEEFFENARAFKYMHDHSIDGPSNYLVRSVRRDFKRNR